MSDTVAVNPAPRVPIVTALMNPFYYLAGGPALGIGLALILLSALLGFFGNTHFDGVLDSHTGRAAPLWVFLAEGLVDWLVLALPLYLAGRLLSRSQGLRAVDVFGTQALARAPYLLVALATLLPGYQRTVARVIENLPRIFDRSGAPPTPLIEHGGDFAVFLVVTVFGVLMLVWMVALMYRSYALSCNIKGARAVVSFIVSILIAEVLSKLAVGSLIGLSVGADG